MTPEALLSRLLVWFRRRPRRPGGSRGTGYDWERLAERRLTEAGYRILARNYRTRVGEIDFVAEEKGVLCFVEVKGRSGLGYGLPAESVTAEKQRRIFRAAEAYLARHRRRRPPCRFDVVSIASVGGKRTVEILRDAFQGPPRRRRRR